MRAARLSGRPSLRLCQRLDEPLCQRQIAGALGRVVRPDRLDRRARVPKDPTKACHVVVLTVTDPAVRGARPAGLLQLAALRLPALPVVPAAQGRQDDLDATVTITRNDLPSVVPRVGTVSGPTGVTVTAGETVIGPPLQETGAAPSAGTARTVIAHA